MQLPALSVKAFSIHLSALRNFASWPFLEQQATQTPGFRKAETEML
jgi:hypothetical protein